MVFGLKYSKIIIFSVKPKEKPISSDTGIIFHKIKFLAAEIEMTYKLKDPASVTQKDDIQNSSDV